MNITEDFLVKNIECLHKATHLLAARASGIEEEKLVAYPSILKIGERLCCVSVGFPGADSDFIMPYVINAAFGLEMCLKLLLLCESKKWEETHNLNNLYLAVSHESKSHMKDVFDKLVKSSSVYKDISRRLNEDAKIQFSWNLDKLIAQSSTAFDDWRYAFESSSRPVSCFAGYFEIRTAILSAIDVSKSKDS